MPDLLHETNFFLLCIPKLNQQESKKDKLETATLYWNPDAPNEIFAVGEKRDKKGDGVVEPPAGERGVVAVLLPLE